jgi:hypothetical protein
MKSGRQFGDFELGEHVVLRHKDAREPEVELWRAEIKAVNEDRRTYDVYIFELAKSVHSVQPSLIFWPKKDLPAV